MEFYFETSALNFWAAKLSVENASATKAYQKLKGRKFYLSPVTIWEVLLTSQPMRKEELIFFAQHLFEEKLLISPSEIIINFIHNGCPLHEKPYDINSKLELSKVWEDLCSDTRKTFHYDAGELKKKINIIREISSMLDQALKNQDLSLAETSVTTTTQITVEGILNSLPFYKEEVKILNDPQKRNIYKIAIFFILFILCSELELSPEPIQDFWNKLGLNRVIDRIEYFVANLEVLVYRGPFVEMAFMAYHQFQSKPTRGLFFDCLHSLYFPYITHFFTNDEHFRVLRNSVEHPNFQKILLMDEIQIFTVNGEEQGSK